MKVLKRNRLKGCFFIIKKMFLIFVILQSALTKMFSLTNEKGLVNNIVNIVESVKSLGPNLL